MRNRSPLEPSSRKISAREELEANPDVLVWWCNPNLAIPSLTSYFALRQILSARGLNPWTPYFIDLSRSFISIMYDTLSVKARRSSRDASPWACHIETHRDRTSPPYMLLISGAQDRYDVLTMQSSSPRNCFASRSWEGPSSIPII